MTDYFDTKSLLQNGVSTLVLVTALLALRYLAVKALDRSTSLATEVRRRWTLYIRNITVLLCFLSVGIIWASEIRTVALSITAILVAIVLATKELILCLTGTMVKTVSRPFGIGDRVEIGGFRGDVIDQNLFTTKLLEVGPDSKSHQQTGRAITIPNKMFVEVGVINETYTDDFLLHIFVIPIQRLDGWERAEKILLDVAFLHCRDFLEKARWQFARKPSQFGFDVPQVEPRIILGFPDPTTVNLIVRICVPAREKGRVEQEIIRSFLRSFYEEAQAGGKV